MTARPTRPICDTAIFGDVPLREQHYVSLPARKRSLLLQALHTLVLYQLQLLVQTLSAAFCVH
jgi:hypothetical protein